MKKLFICILVFNVFVCQAQVTTTNKDAKEDNKEAPVIRYQFSITFDTLISPSFYDVTISLAEYKIAIRKKKRYEYITITSDSLLSLLSNRLQKLKIDKSSLILSSITDKAKENYYTDHKNDKLQQRDYYLKIANAGQLKLLCDSLKFEGFYGITSSGNIDDIRESVEASLIEKGLEKAKQKAEDYAKSQNLKVKSKEYLSQHFYNNKEFPNQVSSYNTRYTVSLTAVYYAVNINVTYILE